MKSKSRWVALFISTLFVWSNVLQFLPTASAESESVTLMIAKSVDKTSVAPGEVFTYTIDYSISGTGSAANATIVDELPDGLEYVSSIKTVHVATVSTANSAGRDVVTFAFQPSSDTGISGKLRISVRFKNGVTIDGATAVNHAVFHADGLTDVTSNDVTTTAHIVAPTWSISKTQVVPSGTAVAGYPVQYRIRVNGNASGSLNLTNVRISDVLPEGAVFSSATNGGDYDEETNTVTWPQIANIGVGSSVDRYVTVTYPADRTQDAVDTAKVTALFYGDSEDQPEKTATCTTTFGAASPGMGSITKTNRQVQEEYHIGQTAKYGINGVSNNGNVPLDNFTIEDAMPDEVNLTSVSTGNFNTSLPLELWYSTSTAAPYDWTLWNQTTTTANQTLTLASLGLAEGTHVTRLQWRMGTVPAGFAQTAMISVQGVIQLPGNGIVTNTATLNADYNSVAQPTKSSTVNFNLVDAIPWLVPSKALQGSTSRDFGEDVTWTLVVKNHDYATGMLVNPGAIDVLPPQLLYTPGSYTVSAPAGVTVGTPTVTDQTIGGKACKVLCWPITGNLEPGDSVTINLTTQIADQTPVGWVTNNFYITTNSTAILKGNLVDDTDNLDQDASTTKLAGAQAQVFVKFQGALTTESWVKGELDSGWTKYSVGNYGQTLPGGLANYRFTIKNDGSNGPISDIVAINLLPHSGDRLIIGGTARGTQWKPYLVNQITGPNGAALPGQLKIYYTMNPNPSYAELYDPISGANGGDGWSLTPPADITSVTALKFVFGGYALDPGDSLTFEWPMRAPQGAPTGQIAWDSMGIGATCLGADGPDAFLPTESSKVGFIIADHIPYFGVGDHVWLDANGNGIQDNGEAGVNDVLVNLYDADQGTLLAFTRTGDNQSGAAGYYAFPSLIANGSKRYTIEYIFPSSYRQTVYNADNALDGADTNTDSDVDSVTVNGGSAKGSVTFTSPDYSGYAPEDAKPDKMNYDLGIFQPASLGGVVWNDADWDGVQDAGEARLSGVTVALKDAAGQPVTDADGQPVADVTTAADCSYQFANLKPGDYKVTVSNPSAANFIYTTANAGSDDTKDSDADASGIIPVTLLSGDDVASLDAGLHKGILQGKVWHDLDADGVQDGGSETGVQGITVTAHLGGSSWNTTTAGDGSYSFADMDAGSYTVEVQPGSYYLTDKDAATDTTDSDFDPTAKTTDAFALATGSMVTNMDCGLFLPATVGDYVWNDVNWNGVQDTGEANLSGVTIQLTDQSGNTVKDVDGVDIAAATTDASGIYGFAKVRPGAYRITVVNPSAANYIFSPVDQGGNDAKDSDVNASGIYNFSVTSGAAITNIDAGLHKGILQGKVWHDLDADGVQDGSSETGIQSITMVAHLGGSSWSTTTTADGSYSFADMDAGSYTIEVQPGSRYVTTKDAATDTTDSDFNPATKYTDALALAAGQRISSIDCGLFLPATIGDYVWNDKNWNGVQDAGEAVLSGVTVQLTDQSGNTVKDVDGVDFAAATTNGSGIYGFAKVRPGAYRITVVNPSAANYIFTPADQGGNDTKDSDVNASGIYNFSVTSGATITNIDAGLHKGILQGKVWHDLDADGVQDGGSETGIQGITVVAHLGGSSWSTITASDGSYSFADMDAGSYTVEVQPASRYVTYKDAATDTTDSDFDPATKYTDALALAAGQRISSIDCGLFLPATVGNFVWNDTNRNGVQDAGEPGLAGAVVSLLTTGGLAVNDVDGNPINAVTSADTTGAYGFSLIRPGTYKLHFADVAEYMHVTALQGSDTALDSNPDATTGDTAAFTLQSGATNLTLDAGYYKAMLGDLVWDDLDADGVQDAGEPGIAGVTVRLYKDTDADYAPSVGDSLIAFRVTDANGRYSFTELDHGFYYLQVVLPNGAYVTTFNAAAADRDSNIHSDGYTSVFSLGTGLSDDSWDAGLFRAATLGNFVWEDMDADGLQDAGEPGIAGVTVRIRNGSQSAVNDVDGNAMDAVTTDSNGAYQTPGLRPGTYTLQFVLPNGYRYSPTTGPAATGSDATTPNGWTAAVTLTSGQTNNNLDGGLHRPAALQGQVWKETTNNGLQDAGEAGISSVTVELLDTLNAVSQTTTTDADGLYAFSGITPGSWHIRVQKPLPKLLFASQNVGSDDTVDSDVSAAGSSAAVTLTSGQVYDHMDAGISQSADIAVTKSSDKASYRLADTIVFTITTENLGPDAATGVMLYDVLPAGISYQSDDAAGSYNSATGVWTVGSLASGASTTLHISAKSTGTGSFSNTASLQSLDQIDGYPGNNSSTAPFTVENSANLSVTKTVDEANPWLNGTVIYTIQVTNHGPDTATGTKVDDQLPASLHYVSDDGAGKYNSATGVWTIGSLANGASTTLHISAKAIQTGETVNTAVVSATEYDVDPSDNQDSATLTAWARADLQIQKSADHNNYSAGDTIIYTLTATNHGPDAATGVVVDDPLPANGTFVSSSGDGAFDAGTGRWTIGNLANGASATLLITVTAATTGTLHNEAAIDGNEVDPVSTNNDDAFDVLPSLCSLGDTVWEDLNANGSQDVDEPGVAGVTVRLYSDDGDGVANAGDTLAGTATTDADGSFTFTGIADGPYYLRVSIPTGWHATTQAAATASADSNIDATGLSDLVTLVAGQAEVRWDAGLFRPAAVGDRAWVDNNANGIQDGGEPALAGVTVNLRDDQQQAVTDLSGAALDAATTDADGNYRFDDLRPGNYMLQFVLPDGYSYTGTGGPAATGSDATAPDGWTAAFALQSGDSDMGQDAGFYQPVQISGKVWKETINDDVRGTGEASVAGHTVQLLDALDTVLQTAATDVDGGYSYTGLTPGTYRVRAASPAAGLFFATANAGSDDTVDSDVDADGYSTAITLTSGQSAANLDAGIGNCADIQVTKVSDKATYAFGEPLVFTITAQNLGPDDATNVQLSDVLPDGLSYNSDDSTDSYNSATGVWTVGDLGSGQSAVLTLTAEATRSGTFTNTSSLQSLDQLDAFSSNNSDTANVVVGAAADLSVEKTVDDATPWLNETVTYTLRVRNNGPDDDTDVLVDDLLPSSLEYVSDNSGGSYNAATSVWTIGSLTKGQTQELQITATAMALGTATNTAAVHGDLPDHIPANNTASCDIVVAARADLEIIKTADHTNYSAGDTIVYTLTATNHGPDAATGVVVDDPLPANATFVSSSGDGAYSAATGRWTIGSLANGASATLLITVTAGTTGTLHNEASIGGNEADPVPENNDSAFDVLPSLCSLGDTVWEDINANGRQDVDEPGVAGVIVRLYSNNSDGLAFHGDALLSRYLGGSIADAGDTLTGTTTTDADGHFTFTGIADGPYYLRVTIPTGWYATAQAAATASTDSNIDAAGCSDLVTLVAGQSEDRWDAGLFRAASVGDKVWVDSNANGIQEDGEPALAGVTVKIRDDQHHTVTSVTGAALDAVTTDASGNYRFDDLRPGSYALQFVLPNGYRYTGTGGPAATGSDATAPDGWTAAIVLNSGDSDASQDAGFYQPVQVSGKVWKETVNDDLRRSGEAGIASYTVQLLDALDNVLQTASTGADGSYAFTGLTPGTYRVHVAPVAAGLFFATADAGSDDTVDSDVDTDGYSPAVTLTSGQSAANLDAGIRNCTDIQVTKVSDKASYAFGQPLVFTITAKNLGPDVATGVKLIEALPAGLRYAADDSNGRYNRVTGVWNVGSLGSGQSAVLTLTAEATRSGTFANTATLQGVDQLDAFSGNNSATATVVVKAAADLSVEKTVDNTVPWLNTTVTYTLKVRNNGPDDDIGVLVEDRLPASLEYVSDTSGGSYNAATGIWTIGSLDKGQSKELQITATAQALGTVTNTAVVRGDLPDHIPANNTASRDIEVAARADLQMDKQADAETYTYGDTVNFTLTVTNNGPDNATHVNATDMLPDGVTYVSHQGDGSYDPATGNWSIGSLSLGAKATLVLQTTAGQTGVITNAAEVHGLEADPVPDNNADSASVQPKHSGVGDTVWLDSNGNGIQQSSEPGVAGVPVTLKDADGNVIVSTSTDKDGHYRFDDVLSDRYTVSIAIPGNHMATSQHAGDDTALDSDGDADGTSPLTLLKAGVYDDTMDFGIYVPNTIVCRAWYDKNRNGLYDADESPMAGITVNLYHDGVLYGTTTTDQDGMYTFNGLPDGSYSLKFSLPDNMEYTPGTGINPNDGTRGNVSLGGGQTVTVDSGYVDLSSPATGSADYNLLVLASLLALLGTALYLAGRKRPRRKIKASGDNPTDKTE